VPKAYGECQRSGERVNVEDLVDDGHLKGLKVARWWYEPEHPQDRAPSLRPERHKVIAPEVSKPDGEGTEAPAIAFDSTGKLTF
jgi:hypothetical protein